MIAPLGRRPKRHGSILLPCALMKMRPDQAMPDRITIDPRIAHRLAVALPVLASLAACAPGPTPETAQAKSAPARAETQETPVCRPDPALLAPQSAPDCKFGRAALKTLDPDQWARLKLEYERQCYQHAEKVVRERFRLLQAASRC
ncbi:MAG TPA: hypothetical protein VHJ00_02575 [Bradyrhizobium sp.]|nr:hypothetical protein [Bradyrhizobium sp.]